MKKLIILLSTTAMISFSTASFASEKMSMDEVQAQLQQLKSQINHLSKVVEEQNDTIKKQSVALKSQNMEAQEIKKIVNKKPTPSVRDNNVKMTMKPSPKIESSDGKYSMQVSGRVHADATFFDDDKFDHANNANIRRARLGVKGNLGEDFKYKTEIDFAGNNSTLTDVTLTYTGLDFTDVTIGNSRPSFGMEENISSNNIMFIERSSATNSFTTGRQLGVNLSSGGDNWSLAGGVFNESPGSRSTGDDEDISFNTRATTNILGLIDNETDDVLHIGAAYSMRKPNGDVRFRARPGVGDGARSIDTGNITNVDKANLYGLELAAVKGPVTFQSEYFRADLNRENGNPDISLDGYYAQAGIILTGEKRTYKGKSGSFNRIKPNNDFSLTEKGKGALELAVRYDKTDLNDIGSGINGGEMETWTAGVNWHLNNNTRLMANVIDVDTDNNAATTADDDPMIYNLRAQWDF